MLGALEALFFLVVETWSFCPLQNIPISIPLSSETKQRNLSSDQPNEEEIYRNPLPPKKNYYGWTASPFTLQLKKTQIFYPSTSQNRLLNPFSWFCKPVLARCAELGPADIWSLSISDMPFSPLFFRPFFPLALFHRCDVLLSRHQCKQGLGPDCPRSFHRSSSPERWRNKDDPWLGPIVGPEKVSGSW